MNTHGDQQARVVGLREKWTSNARARGLTIGTALGLLAGYLLVQFGLDEIMNVAAEWILVPLTLAGAALGAIGAIWPLVGVDALLVVAFFTIANTPVMRRVAERWVRADELPPSADAIVVLSAGLNSEGMLNTAGLQRLLTGLELYQRGIAPKLFTTEVQARFGRLVRTSVADQERLVTLGGARGAWTSLGRSRSTHDEAQRTAAQLPPGDRTVVVVTSPMHTRRACATFEGVGLKVVCVPSREHGPVTWHPLNTVDRLASFREYFYERLGTIEYRARGWLPKPKG